ncbi:hypothetical protein D3C76_172250 [compost metagenome]
MHPELQRQVDPLVDPVDQLDYRFLNIPEDNSDFRRASPIPERNSLVLQLQEFIADIDDGIIQQLAVSPEPFDQRIIAGISLDQNQP